MLRILKCPYVLSLHGGNLPSFSRRWPVQVKQLLRGAAAVVTPSGYLLAQMAPYRIDLSLLPNPIDLSSYAFQLRSCPQPNLIWLRAFHSIYNPTLAPRVLAELLPDSPEARLTMVGPDKGDGSLYETRRVADEAGVLHRLQFAGAVAKREVPGWMNAGDIFINTTNVDNTPISVMEAMACGLCIVSTNVGGIPYLLDNEQDALLVPPDDPKAMVAAVRRILSEPGLAERLSGNARRKVAQFDWSVILPLWNQLLISVIENYNNGR